MKPKAVSGPLHANEYRCSHCGQIYGLVSTDEECKAEELENFGFNASDADREILCDDCYTDFMAWYHMGGALNPAAGRT